MSGRPIARRSRVPVTTRRTRSVRRASARLSATRAGAALAMLVSAAAVYGVATSSAFDYVNLQVDGAVFTNPTTVETEMTDARGENLFRLATGPLQARLEQLPTVAHARIDVRLPGTLAVSIEERQPVLIWKAGLLTIPRTNDENRLPLSAAFFAIARIVGWSKYSMRRPIA